MHSVARDIRIMKSSEAIWFLMKEEVLCNATMVYSHEIFDALASGCFVFNRSPIFISSLLRCFSVLDNLLPVLIQCNARPALKQIARSDKGDEADFAKLLIATIDVAKNEILFQVPFCGLLLK